MINKKIDINLLNNSMIGHLGIEFLDSESDRIIKATMPVDHRTSQPFGILNGGASLALGECIAGYGSYLLCSDDKYPVGVQVSANHMSSVPVGNSVLGIGTLIHEGKSSHIWNVDIMSQDNRMISSIRIVNFIYSKK